MCGIWGQADDRQVAAKMIDLYEHQRLDPEKLRVMHRVSKYLLACAEGCLGSDFRQYARTGVMSVALRTEVTAYQMCMLDDSMVEGPHSTIGRTSRCASTSTPAWWSATIRLEQNSQDRESKEEAMPGRFEWLFQHWKIMGQRSTRKYSKGIMQRISTADFKHLVYRSRQFNLADCSILRQRHASQKDQRKARGKDATTLRQPSRCHFCPRKRKSIIICNVRATPRTTVLNGGLSFEVLQITCDVRQ